MKPTVSSLQFKPEGKQKIKIIFKIKFKYGIQNSWKLIFNSLPILLLLKLKQKTSQW